MLPSQSLSSLIREFWRQRSPLTLPALSLACLVPAFFVVYTGEVWEDFLITYRHSENLLNGHGLVYTPGERVHGFTSPLNVLLPALFGWLLQVKHFAWPLFLFRLVSLAGLIFGATVLTALLQRDESASRGKRLLALLFPLLMVLEIKTTAFAMNGQEAGLMVGFLAPTFALAWLGWPRDNAPFGGLCLAGLMYTRPDGFVFAGAAILAALVFTTHSRRDFLRSLLRSVLIAAALYLPWIIFTTAYYGSPIPHTIIAKHGMVYGRTEAFGLLAPLARGFANLPDRACGIFAGIYDFLIIAGPITWPGWSRDGCLAFGLISVTYWAVPGPDRLGRTASLACALMLSYLVYVSQVAAPAPWYYPPLACLSLFTLLRIFSQVPARLALRWAPAWSALLCGAVVVILGFIHLNSVRALRIKQEIVDGGNRREVGLWLRANVRGAETVFLEPLGYIGYYSQCKMLDWPGLASPEVVATRRQIGQIKDYPWGSYLWGKAAEALKPEWIVARPTEADQMKASPALTRDYRLVRVFNVADQVLAAGEFPGCSINFDDCVFMIYRRRPMPEGQ